MDHLKSSFFRFNLFCLFVVGVVAVYFFLFRYFHTFGFQMVGQLYIFVYDFNKYYNFVSLCHFELDPNHINKDFNFFLIIKVDNVHFIVIQVVLRWLKFLL